MIAARLHPEIPPAELDPRNYRLAGCDVLADRPLPALAPFAAAARSAAFPPPPAAAPEAVRVFAGEALLAGTGRRIECFLDRSAYFLSVSGGGSFSIARDGSAVHRLPGGEPPGPPVLAAVFLGPVLALALALRGTLCLHASAVAAGGRAIAFVGESGAGKSTLAVLLGSRGWPRLADDLLPVASPPRPAGAMALPRFPQLKLGTGEAPPAAESLPLAAVYRLEPAADEVSLRPLGKSEGTLALVRHTVAARLFSPDLLDRHLGLCADLAAEVSMRSLSYPWRPDAAPRLRAAIASDLGIVAGGRDG